MMLQHKRKSQQEVPTNIENHGRGRNIIIMREGLSNFYNRMYIYLALSPGHSQLFMHTLYSLLLSKVSIAKLGVAWGQG